MNELKQVLGERYVTPEILAEFARSNMAYVEKCLATHDFDEWFPALAVMALRADSEEPENMLFVIADGFPEGMKMQVMVGLAVKVYESKSIPLAAALSIGAWHVVRPRDGGGLLDNLRPRDDVNRIESIACVAANLDCTACVTAMLEVKRQGSAQAIAPAKFGEMHVTGVRSDMLHAFFAGYCRHAKACIGRSKP